MKVVTPSSRPSRSRSRLTVSGATCWVPLTTAEYQLLEAFVANPNQVLGRDRLLEVVAGRKWQPYDRTIDQHISRLRRKLERDPNQPELIKSIRGQGYLFARPGFPLPTVTPPDCAAPPAVRAPAASPPVRDTRTPTTLRSQCSSC